MLKSYLLIAIRGMMKNKLFVIINVFGMGIAVASCIVAFLAHQYDSTFDDIHSNGAKIFRVGAVRQFENTLTRYGYAAFPLGEIVDKTFQDVDKVTRYASSQSNFKRADELFESQLSYVDPAFFEMFTWEFIEGNSSGLTDKTSVMISELMAARLFGTPDNAMGKTITQVYGTDKKEVKVSGVFREPPPNSSFYKKAGAAYMSFESYKDEQPGMLDDDWKQTCSLFVQINNTSRVDKVQQQLQQYVANNNKVRDDFQVEEFTLDPLTTMAHRDRAEDIRSTTWEAPPISAISGAVVMATLILLIACFNLTNTAIAISSRRLKEIGIRKVMGSRRTQLVFQFIGETTFICFLSLLVGVGLADSLIAGWNIISGNNIYIGANYVEAPSVFLFLGGILVFTGVLAGSYPALYVSKFQPVSILKGKLRFGGTNYFTRVLLALQFAFSLIAVVNAIAFMQNARYQENYDLGFNIRGSVIASVNNQSEFDTYHNALRSNPQILAIAGAQNGIFSSPEHGPVKHDSKQAEVVVIHVGENYLNAMGLELIEGRDFIKDSGTDEKESVIITQKMANVFGWQQPVGKEIIWKDTVKLFVIGVVKDVYTAGLWREMEPMIVRYVLPDKYKQVVVSASASNILSVNQYMADEWNKVFQNRLYTGHMLASDLQRVVDLNHSAMYTYAFLGAIALLLSATGLFALVSLNVIRRMKEIGVRKILGASVSNITWIVNTEFVIILVAACGLGSWASYSISNMIISSIWKYYQGVNPITFVISIGLLFTISFLAIGYKVFSVASMNPANTLNDE